MGRWHETPPAWHELRRHLLPLAVPIITESMLSRLMTVVDLLMVGHLGAESLAAAGLGNNFFDLLQHPIFGCATALDTLLSQAFGAKQLDAYAAWTETGLTLLMLLSVPYIVLLSLAGPILTAAGVEHSVAQRAAEFCLQLTWGVPAHLGFHVLTKYCRAQSLVMPSVVIAIIANIANAASNWLLIHGLGLGFSGAPIATSLSRWVQLALILAYMALRRRDLAGTLPSPRAALSCRELPERARIFFRLGVPGALMMALEAWFFEMSTFEASFLGTRPFDAHIVLLNVCAFTFLSFPFAIGIAVSIRVGQALGAGEPSAARRAAMLAMVLVLGVMSSLALLKIVVRDYLGWLFSDDADVVASVSRLVFIAALFQVSDGMQAAVAGVMRGMGKQAVVAWTNVLGFWVLGGPIGSALCFGARLGVAGLWWGMAAGLTVAALVGVGLVLRTDWAVEARVARERAGAVQDRGNDITAGTEVPQAPLTRDATASLTAIASERQHAGSEQAEATSPWQELNPAAMEARATHNASDGESPSTQPKP